jgi:hypothetical protein
MASRIRWAVGFGERDGLVTRRATTGFRFGAGLALALGMGYATCWVNSKRRAPLVSLSVGRLTAAWYSI